MGALDNYSDMWRELQSFPKFTQLPPEIRRDIVSGPDMITWSPIPNKYDFESKHLNANSPQWFAAMPQQFILTRPIGYILIPRLPALLQVCRESRDIMMEHGTPCYYDKWKKIPNSMWINPAFDVLYYTATTTFGRFDGHPVFDKNLFNMVRTITLEQRNVYAFMKQALKLPLLEEILVGMGERGIIFSETTRYWSPSWHRKIFGVDGWRLVNFNNKTKNDIYQLVAWLVEDEKAASFAQGLNQAWDDYTEDWTTIVRFNGSGKPTAPRKVTYPGSGLSESTAMSTATMLG
ncbi:hypothetical protein PG997_005818 [Apiospora hydei]|uniref:2EXR domain-containing protein n=1 Tax=Apiospora hydei TaxID=1337664 RepID=A0ABR1WNE5_9PEZI